MPLTLVSAQLEFCRNTRNLSAKRAGNSRGHFPEAGSIRRKTSPPSPLTVRGTVILAGTSQGEIPGTTEIRPHTSWGVDGSDASRLPIPTLLRAPIIEAAIDEAYRAITEIESS